MRRRVWIIAACFGLVIAAVTAMRSIAWHHPAQKTEIAQVETPAKTPKPEPSLYCEFYNFTHNATVVSFYFAADLAPRSEPKFTELYVVEPDGTRTDFDAKGRPVWSYSIDDRTAMITSPDLATRLMLFGFKPGGAGVFWTEAGIRSDTYRNLDGKCRQAYFEAAPT